MKCALGGISEDWAKWDHVLKGVIVDDRVDLQVLESHSKACVTTDRTCAHDVGSKITLHCASKITHEVHVLESVVVDSHGGHLLPFNNNYKSKS